jgi:hypothetical protein
MRRKSPPTQKKSPPTELQNLREVSSPWLFEFACPFCGKTEVSMFVGDVEFSAIIGREELSEPLNVALAGLMCAKSHVFFVLESDMAAMKAASAA